MPEREDLVVVRLEGGGEITIQWSEGSRYAIVARTLEGGYEVSQHVEVEATFQEWRALLKDYFIVPRDQDAHDAFVSEHPDTVAGDFD